MGHLVGMICGQEQTKEGLGRMLHQLLILGNLPEQCLEPHSELIDDAASKIVAKLDFESLSKFYIKKLVRDICGPEVLYKVSITSTEEKLL